VDFAGPLETFSYARHNPSDKSSVAFKCYTAGAENTVTSSQGVTVKVDMDFDDATEDLDDFDMLVVCGGNTDPIITKAEEPIPLMKRWVALQEKDPSKERTLFSVCTGSLFLAKAGVLQGLAATTHPDYYLKLEKLCQDASQADTGIRTDVQEERYVVNNARFDLGDNIKDNPFVFTKRPNSPVASKARRGSEAFKLARRRESLLKRADMPLGGLRVITSGGITAGLDAALYLVAALVSIEAAERAANMMQFTWQKGICIDSIDV
jgi:transcriptional regulator GlxA family with amidase domain